MSVAQATDYTISRLALLFLRRIPEFEDMFEEQNMCPCYSNTSSDSKRGMGREDIESERVLTTQNVSHPPVNPKYGAFAPVRPLVNIAMIQGLSM